MSTLSWPPSGEEQSAQDEIPRLLICSRGGGHKPTDLKVAGAMRDTSRLAYTDTSGEAGEARTRRPSAKERACCDREADVCEWCAKVARGAACSPLLVTAVFISASNAERTGTGELRLLVFSQHWRKDAGEKGPCFRKDPSKLNARAGESPRGRVLVFPPVFPRHTQIKLYNFLFFNNFRKCTHMWIPKKQHILVHLLSC